ncbi:Fructose-bisphosphate aldolase class-II [Fragilaria crotonensis]|nr:Fructose-bisphosphate aldolase class-II [Fragilaria crotonensis]
MKFCIAALLIASTGAFAPGASINGVRTTALDMSAVKEVTFTKLPASVKPGVVTGRHLSISFNTPRRRSSPSLESTLLEPTPSMPVWRPLPSTVDQSWSPSKGGGQFIAGKTVDNTDDVASIAGCIAGAKHVREVAALYGVPVILHTDHCQKSWLQWFDGLIEANEEHFAQFGEPLFSSHMLDLSEEPLEENIAICKKYLERMAKIDCLLEFELGVTGGEEDGVDNSDVDSSRLYTQPEEVWYSYEQLSQVPNAAFTCAASFGNVHGVYAPGNVELKPEILHNTQKYIQEKLGTDDTKPMLFVFHGGSGSSREDIQYAIEAGVVKMNIDTDTQWAFWDGIRAYEAKYHDYLQGQIGNPDGPEKPNKKYYDLAWPFVRVKRPWPHVWSRQQRT